MYNTSVIELYTPGTMITAKALTAVTQGQLVKIAADTDTEHPNVTVADEGAAVFGIASTDAPAGALVTIQRGQARCFQLPTTATIAAGAELQAGADGAPTTATDGTIIGYALHASTGDHVNVTLA